MLRIGPKGGAEPMLDAEPMAGVEPMPGVESTPGIEAVPRRRCDGGGGRAGRSWSRERRGWRRGIGRGVGMLPAAAAGTCEPLGLPRRRTAFPAVGCGIRCERRLLRSIMLMAQASRPTGVRFEAWMKEFRFPDESALSATRENVRRVRGVGRRVRVFMRHFATIWWMSGKASLCGSFRDGSWTICCCRRSRIPCGPPASSVLSLWKGTCRWRALP